MESKEKNPVRQNDSSQDSSWKRYFAFGEVGNYFFRKKDPTRPTNFSIKAMHGINKFSIIVFLLGVIYTICKHLF